MKIGVLVDIDGVYAGDFLHGMEVADGYEVITVPIPDGVAPAKFNKETEEWTPIRPEKSLDEVKTKKIKDLDENCAVAIMSGFTSNALGEPHQYACDIEAQLNMSGTKEMFNTDPTFTSIDWKTDKGLVPHTKEQFIQVWKDAFLHVKTTVDNFRAKKANTEAATTVEDVDSIIW